MKALRATVRPRSGPYALRKLRHHFLALDHVVTAPGEHLVQLPGAGAVAVTEDGATIAIDIAVPSEAAKLTAIGAIEQFIADHDSSISVTWTTLDVVPGSLR
jgi:hypothetical protein